jgi:hypothetical protein
MSRASGPFYPEHGGRIFPPEPNARLHGVQDQNLNETPLYLLGLEPMTFQPLLSHFADFTEWRFVRSPSSPGASSPPDS